MAKEEPKWDVNLNGLREVPEGLEIKGIPGGHTYFIGHKGAGKINSMLKDLQSDPNNWAKVIQSSVELREDSLDGVPYDIDMNLTLRALGVQARRLNS